MATQLITVLAPSGLDLEVILYADGDDTPVAAETLTEDATRDGYYSASMTDDLAGLHLAVVSIAGGAHFGDGWAYLVNEDGEYFIEDSRDEALLRAIRARTDLIISGNVYAVQAFARNGSIHLIDGTDYTAGTGARWPFTIPDDAPASPDSVEFVVLDEDDAEVVNWTDGVISGSVAYQPITAAEARTACPALADKSRYRCWLVYAAEKRLLGEGAIYRTM